MVAVVAVFGMAVDVVVVVVVWDVVMEILGMGKSQGKASRKGSADDSRVTVLGGENFTLIYFTIHLHFGKCLESTRE